MTSIRPSMPGVQQMGPTQNVQRQQQAPKTEEAKAPPPKEEAQSLQKDENKTKTFDDTPMEDVSLKFEGEAKAADATSEIEGLFDAEAPEETGEVEEAEESEEVEGEGEVEEAEAPETGEVEEEEEEEEAGEAGDYEEGEGGAEAEARVNVAPLLELLPQLRELPKFRIEETWPLYG